MSYDSGKKAGEWAKKNPVAAIIILIVIIAAVVIYKSMN